MSTSRKQGIFGSLSAVCLAGLLGIGWAPAAGAFLITDTGVDSTGNPGGQDIYEVSGLIQGDSFNITWGGVDGLSATAMVFIDSLSNNAATIGVMIDNTSDPISGDDPRITSFGISIDSGLIDDDDPPGTSGAFLTVADISNFPGFGVLNCATSNNNCAGGGSGGIPAGGSDTLTLELFGMFGLVPTLTLDAFAIKIQGGPDGVNGDSYELAGMPTPKDVPEPTTLLLLGLGIAGLGAFRRRRAN